MENAIQPSPSSPNHPDDRPGMQDSTRPAVLECSGSELAGLLADLKARGCIVLGMASICVSRWRLSLEWPEQQDEPRSSQP